MQRLLGVGIIAGCLLVSSAELNIWEKAALEHSKHSENVTYKQDQLWAIDFSHLDEHQKSLTAAIGAGGGFDIVARNIDEELVLIKKHNVDDIKSIFENNKIHYTVKHDDLQKAFDKINPLINNKNVQKGADMSWDRYYALNEIHAFLDDLVQKYPNHCSVSSIGQSEEGRDLKMIKISNGNAGNKVFFIEGGIHAREWISPAVTTYIIDYISKNIDSEQSEVGKIDWYIVPVTNPDGYVYSQESDQMWRKNRHKGQSCPGVDLNRNFGFKWGGAGQSRDPCDDTYAGASGFSELESSAISKFLNSMGANVKAYLSFHSYGQYIIHPYGYDTVEPIDIKDLKALGADMAKAIKETSGHNYRVIAPADLYPASGISIDWAKGDQNIKYSYTVELGTSFAPDKDEIESIAKEGLAGTLVMAKAVANM